MNKNDLVIVKEKRRTKTRRGERPRFDLAKAVLLKLKGNTLVDISRVLGVRLATTQYHFNKLTHAFQDPELLKLYEKNRIAFLQSLQMTLGVEIFDKAKLKKASVNNLAYAFSQFYNAERLELGQSTSNIAYADMVKAQRDDMERLKELKAKIQMCDKAD
jgi:hypothetical protein